MSGAATSASRSNDLPHATLDTVRRAEAPEPPHSCIPRAQALSREMAFSDHEERLTDESSRLTSNQVATDVIYRTMRDDIHLRLENRQWSCEYLAVSSGQEDFRESLSLAVLNLLIHVSFITKATSMTQL